MFEAKVLSDIACHVAFDPLRNQLVRNIDVMLDAASMPHLPRSTDLTLFCLLTPAMFKERPSSRYYGMLFNEYTSDGGAIALRRDLAHRDATIDEGVVRRLGWLTFEDCTAVCPNACPWH